MTVTDDFKTAFYAQQTGECPLVLLKIDHDDLASPIYVVNNGANITSNGTEYTAFPFEIKMPDADMRAELSICNVDRQIVLAIRTISSPAEVTISVILASDPDTVEVGPYVFGLTDVSFDAFTVRGRLSFDEFYDEPYPGDRFTPGQFSGLF